MKAVKVAPFRIGRHEFYRAARTMAQTMDREKIFLDLVQRRDQSRSLFSKQFALIVLAFVIITASPSNLFVELKTSFAEIKIFKLYLVLFEAIATGMSIIQFINFMTINEYHRLYCSRILGFDNADIRSVPYDGSSVWAHPFNIMYRFLRTTTLHKTIAYAAVLIMFSPILIVYYAIFDYELRFIYEYVRGYGYIPYGKALSIVAGLFLIFPLLVIAFTFTPITYAKNEAYIRWTFLLRLYKRYMATAHDGSHWGIRPRPLANPNSTLDI